MSFQNTARDGTIAWPTAEIAVMGAKGAVEIHSTARNGGNPGKGSLNCKELRRTHFANPYVAARRG